MLAALAVRPMSGMSPTACARWDMPAAQRSYTYNAVGELAGLLDTAAQITYTYATRLAWPAGCRGDARCWAIRPCAAW